MIEGNFILLLIKLFSEQLFDEYFIARPTAKARIAIHTADVMKIVRVFSLEKKFESFCRLYVVPSRDEEFPLVCVPPAPLPPPFRLIIIQGNDVFFQNRFKLYHHSQ